VRIARRQYFLNQVGLGDGEIGFVAALSEQFAASLVSKGDRRAFDCCLRAE
jgi:hypothetical protein